MNRLLKSQRKWLVLFFGLEAMSIIALYLVFFFIPEYLNYCFYISLGLLAFFVIFDFIFIAFYNIALQRQKGKAELRASAIIGNDLNEAYNFGEVGLAVCDQKDIVIWTNDFLSSRIPNLVDENIYKRFPEIQRLQSRGKNANTSNDYPRLHYENRVYEIELIPEARLFILRDITDFNSIYLYNQNQSPVVGYIAIDNYSDVQMSIGDDAVFVEQVGEIHKIIKDFATNYNALLRKIKDDRYLLITTRENYDKILEAKFKIVNDISKKYPDNPFTASFGIALGFPDYAKLASMASSALDVALSRGGDQTVVDFHGQPLQYFGGKADSMPSRNRVKTRTLSNSFMTILKNYSNIVIMGHKTADFDAIGACLGVYLICGYVGVDAKICWEDQLIEAKCRLAIQDRYDKDEMDDMFVKMREIDSLIHDKTLLVLVDHNNPNLSIFSAYVKKFDNIAVIDHHLSNDFMVNDPIFEDIDPSASSACEILTSFLVYSPNNINVDERTATFLLSGICLDTHFYKEHSTNATFEASAQLKNWDASMEAVVDYLKEDLDEYRQKISILGNSEIPYSDIYVSISPEDEIVDEVTLSRVADEGLSVRGIVASFCIGRINPHTIKISARSHRGTGGVNVGMLMEKIGGGHKGGGRDVMAAATFAEANVDEAKRALMEVLDEYLDDARRKN